MFAKNRFMCLWYNIHVVDNTPSVPRDHLAHDRLFKMLRLITILNDTCGELRSVAKNFHRRKHGMFQRPQHDEAVLTYEVNQARLQDLVFIPLFLRVTSQVQIYTDKETQGDPGLAHRVVTHLVIPRFRSNNYVVYMDNFFTFIAIFRERYENCILACGTYRTNRIGLPADLTDRMSWSHWDAARHCSVIRATPQPLCGWTRSHCMSYQMPICRQQQL